MQLSDYRVRGARARGGACARVLAWAPMTPVEALRAKVAELRLLEPALLQARVKLFDQRVHLEELVESLSADTDTDPEVVLLTISAAWRVHIAATKLPEANLFREAVLADVRAVLVALTGCTDPLSSEAERTLQSVIEAGKAGVRPVPVKDIMLHTGQMITASMPG